MGSNTWRIKTIERMILSMNKIGIGIMFILLFNRAYSKGEINVQYFVKLANNTIEEIIKIEGEKLIKTADHLKFDNQFKKSDYDRIVSVVKGKSSFKENDIYSIMYIADKMRNEDINISCEPDKWNSYLTYSIFISLLMSNQNIRNLAANKILQCQCRQLLKPFSLIIKKRIDSSIPKYRQLLSICELDKKEKEDFINDLLIGNRLELLTKIETDSIEKLYIRDKIKNKFKYEYSTYFGDKEAEIKLLSVYDTLETYDEKEKFVEKLFIANTENTNKLLIKMLDDTDKVIIFPGVEISLRSKIFNKLRKVFYDNELFNKELNDALKSDMRENEEGRIIVNNYFNKVANWASTKYNIELPNLKKADYFMKGHFVPINISD